ncbi:hypothetical protein ACRTJZ_004121, partial [Escherichia coli]
AGKKASEPAGSQIFITRRNRLIVLMMHCSFPMKSAIILTGIWRSASAPESHESAISGCAVKHLFFRKSY